MRNRSLEQKLIRHHAENSARLQQIVDQGDRTRDELSTIVDTLHALLTDQTFASLLRNERLGRMPKILHDLLMAKPR
jgi:hypothetical protein